MSSLRQKFNSKIANSGKKPEDTLTAYDETHLRINAVGGQTQLCPIKLNCLWENPAYGSKPPELSCKWFNLTQDSINEIPGVTGSYYQPCMQDVGTIIHIQCIPVYPGRQYEGMPIIKDVGPIKLDPETEEEANDLLECGKGSYLIKLIGDPQEVIYHEGLIKVAGSEFRVISKKNEDKEIACIQISDTYPKFDCSRTSPKRMKLTLSQEQIIEVQFSNNKMRDSLMLMVRLIAAKEPTRHSPEDLPPALKSSEITNTPAKSEKSQEQKDPTEQREASCSSHHTSEKEQPKSTPDQKKEQSPKPNKVNMQIALNVVEQVRSEGDFALAADKYDTSKKNNTQTLLEIAELKDKVKTLSESLQQEKKKLRQHQQASYQTEQDLAVLKERQTNFNHNYFLLEEQLKSTKNQLVKCREQMSYYQNECRIAKADRESLQRKSNSYLQQMTALQEKLSHFEDINSELSYFELQAKLQSEQQQRKNIENILFCERSEFERAQEGIAELQQQLETINQERDYFKRKYESLHNEFSRNMDDSYSQSASSPSLSKSRSEISILSPEPFQMQMQEVQYSEERSARMERQILDLKKQVKEVVQENNFLRSINAGVKDKNKSSSKSHLKMELAQLKKIVNRLTENLTEKDLALEHMKKINKDLNARIMELSSLVEK